MSKGSEIVRESGFEFALIGTYYEINFGEDQKDCLEGLF